MHKVLILMIAAMTAISKAEDLPKTCNYDLNKFETQELITGNDKYYTDSAGYDWVAFKHWLLKDRMSLFNRLSPNALRSGSEEEWKEVNRQYEIDNKNCNYDKKIKDIFDKQFEKYICKVIPETVLEINGEYNLRGIRKDFDCASVKSCYSSKEVIEYNKLVKWILPFDNLSDEDPSGILFLNSTRLNCGFENVSSPIGKYKRHYCGQVLSKKMEKAFKNLEETDGRWNLYACFKGPFSVKKVGKKNAYIVPKDQGLLIIKDNEELIFEPL